MSRSRDAPMDFEFTNPDRAQSVLAANSPFQAALESPIKRRQAEFGAGQPGFAPSTPQRNFAPPSATNQSPFPFGTPAPATPFHNGWTPGSAMPAPSPAFPQPQHEQELADVSMTDASPAMTRVEPPVRAKSKPPREPESEPSDEGSEDEYDSPQRKVSTRVQRRTNSRRQNSSNTVVRRRQRRQRTASESEDDAIDEAPTSGGLAKTLNVIFNPHAPMGPAGSPVVQDVPQLLVGYVQFFFNLSVVIVLLYLVVGFIITVQRDVEHRVTEYQLGVIADITVCRREWEQNYCGSDNVGPYAAPKCAELQACMSRDPTVVGRAKVAAEMIGEVVNGFVEPISWKALIFTLTSAAFGVVLVNALLSLYRVRHAEELAINARMRQHSIQHIGHGPYYPPYGQHRQMLPPGYGNGWPQEKGMIEESEPRRRGIE